MGHPTIRRLQGGKELLKRFWCLVCCTFMLCSCFFSFAAAETPFHFSMAGFDGDDSLHEWENNGFFSRMEERTGISFSFDEYKNYAEWQAAKEDMFQTGELPDVLFKADLTTQELIQYTNEGKLLDLGPLLPENAPHLWALLEMQPEYLAAITLPNGKIGALPSIVELPTQNAMWINGEWLDRLQLDAPKNADELRAVLDAFLKNDPNQNRKQDEIPLSFFGIWDLKFLSHAFGVAVNDYNLYMNETDKVCYFPAEPEFLPFVTYLRALYEEKLLDQNGFYMTNTFRTDVEGEKEAIYGVFFGPNPLSVYPREIAKQYRLLEPLHDGGRQIYRKLKTPVTGGTFAVTSACADPAALLRWVDILYTEEGAIEALAGVEGMNYSVDEAGRWQWLGGDEPDFMDKMANLSVYDTGDMPWHFPLEFYNRYAEDEVGRINGELQRLEAFTVNPFETCVLREDQRTRILSLQNELGKYVDEGIARFVLGEWELSAKQMEVFTEGLKERGLEAFVGEWQQIYAGKKP